MWQSPLECFYELILRDRTHRLKQQLCSTVMNVDEVARLCKALTVKVREVLNEPTGKGDTQEMRFNKVAFWIQILSVPLICKTAVIGRFLGNMIGEINESDTGKRGDCVGKYIRVRVVMDIDKPLCSILRVDVLGDDKETKMLLRYERLLEHYFSLIKVSQFHQRIEDNRYRNEGGRAGILRVTSGTKEVSESIRLISGGEQGNVNRGYPEQLAAVPSAGIFRNSRQIRNLADNMGAESAKRKGICQARKNVLAKKMDEERPIGFYGHPESAL
ncbi:hypothetical protein Ddye_008974 [Dipteronia dyeriana]|uniref:DUF4283 domain-containing protein n=1 Tax=Dipteronia dyeriana TaxID=168575 RepID=A0AAD9XAW6_9ROSI|nr:hypothetical protein Ddye_008974 [Dipteronia dyeriana]